MPPQVRYGKVQVSECPCCINTPVAFDSEEGLARRRRFIRRYRSLSTVQLCLSLLALASGATSAALTFLNPNFPFLLCLPLINGVLMLIAAVFGRMVGGAHVDDQVSAAVKRNVIVHYVMCVLGCTFCMLAAAFSSVGLGYCLAPEGSTYRENCSTAHRDPRLAFLAIDIILGFILFVTCIVGCVLFCMHARTVGFSNRMQSMENELNQLRAQVVSLSQAQQQFPGGRGGETGVCPPPAAYSDISQNASYSQGGAYTPQGRHAFYEGGTEGSVGASTTIPHSGKGQQWPAGY
ncbi:hypothetical protein ACOMHN_011535 [Nucella lapillus]